MSEFDSPVQYFIPIGFPRSRIPAIWGLFSREFWGSGGRCGATDVSFRHGLTWIIAGGRLEPRMDTNGHE
ncbi:MAG: hypothetical protein ACK5MM_20230, partial [Planctomyces sp.]